MALGLRPDVNPIDIIGTALMADYTRDFEKNTLLIVMHLSTWKRCTLPEALESCFDEDEDFEGLFFDASSFTKDYDGIRKLWASSLDEDLSEKEILIAYQLEEGTALQTISSWLEMLCTEYPINLRAVVEEVRKPVGGARGYWESFRKGGQNIVRSCFLPALDT